MTFFESFFKWNGKFVDVDKKYGPQCMDYMHQYLMDVYGLPANALSAPTAIDVWNKFPGVIGSSQFKKIINLPWNVPTQGDVMFMGAPYGRYFNTSTKRWEYAGHVAIFNEGNWRRFTSIEQNNPLNSPVHIQEHNDFYRGVKGWLHKI